MFAVQHNSSLLSCWGGFLAALFRSLFSLFDSYNGIPHLYMYVDTVLPHASSYVTSYR